MKVDLAYYRKIFKEIDAQDPAPLYLFLGSEGYIMEEMAGRIADRAVPHDLRCFNLLITYGTEVDIESFVATASSFPFLAEKRVLVIRELEQLRGGWKNLIDYCKQPSPSSIVVFIVNTHDAQGKKIRPPRDFPKLEAAVQGGGRVFRFDPLAGGELQRWIAQKAKKMGMVLDKEALEILVRSVGTNLYELQNELHKLSILYDEAQISAEDLEKVIGRYRMNAVYDLLDAARPDNESAAIDIMSGIFSTGAERPSVVLYQLIRHFLSLLKIKAGFRAGGYMHEMLKRKAGLFQTREIVIWLENLRTAEILLKSTSFPEEILLTSALLHSMRGEVMEDAEGAFPAA
jgi:DNA polymerase-3 subunit delta